MIASVVVTPAGSIPGGYYDWLRHPPSERDEALEARIGAIWTESGETPAHPRIHAALNAEGREGDPGGPRSASQGGESR